MLGPFTCIHCHFTCHSTHTSPETSPSQNTLQTPPEQKHQFVCACDKVPDAGQRWKYPGGTSQFTNVIQEEAEPQGNRGHPEESARKGVKNTVTLGTGAPTAEVMKGRATASRGEGARGGNRVTQGHRAERPEEEQDNGTEELCTEGGGHAETSHVQGRTWPAQIRLSP
ncbi:hypothetical protein NDU88_001954 [Pleurodeles waltl]|uniref:Uncharacterized protein n=1 Tax=Pleurodeles waltl TaxID=8319 RepID=A0AAV7T0U3_PLEWA|nr:hypothetical protein NDU88_001954 [Pleurodeles waltl]